MKTWVREKSLVEDMDFKHKQFEKIAKRAFVAMKKAWTFNARDVLAAARQVKVG